MCMHIQTSRSTFKRHPPHPPTPTAHPTLVWCCPALCCWACSTPAHLITFVIKAVAEGWWIMPELLPRCSCRGNEAAQPHLPHCCWPWRSLTGTRNTSLWHMNAVGRSGWWMSAWQLLLIQYDFTNSAPNSMKAYREFAGCVTPLLIEMQW